MKLLVDGELQAQTTKTATLSQDTHYIVSN